MTTVLQSRPQHTHRPGRPAHDGSRVSDQRQHSLSRANFPWTPAAALAELGVNHQAERQRLHAHLASEIFCRQRLANFAVRPPQLERLGIRQHSAMLVQHHEVIGVVSRALSHQCSRETTLARSGNTGDDNRPPVPADNSGANEQMFWSILSHRNPQQLLEGVGDFLRIESARNSSCAQVEQAEALNAEARGRASFNVGEEQVDNRSRSVTKTFRKEGTPTSPELPESWRAHRSERRTNSQQNQPPNLGG